MEQNLTAAKAAIVAAISAVGAFLGWKGIMALCWIAVMALDYLSGTAAACKAGEWNSAKARSGLWHKGGMIFVVLVAAIADGVMVVIIGNIPGLGIEWPGLVMPLVLTWYILTELGSILENAVKLGAAVPQWLTKLLKAGVKAIEDFGEMDGVKPSDEENREERIMPIEAAVNEMNEQIQLPQAVGDPADTAQSTISSMIE